MATTYTPNLHLRLADNLTEDARYNLNLIDQLGATFTVDSLNTLNIKSISDILIEPQAADLGGAGAGGTVQIGTPSHSITEFKIYATSMTPIGSLNFPDQAIGGTKNLRFKYKSDLTGSVDTTDNRALWFDLEGADRAIKLAGNLDLQAGFSVTGAAITLNSVAGSTITLPNTGTMLTDSGTASLTNKTINASLNTITNLDNSAIKSAAGIDGSKINPDFVAQNIKTSGQLRLYDASTGLHVGFISPVGLTGNKIWQLPSTDGTPGQVLVTNGSAALGWASITTGAMVESAVDVGSPSSARTQVVTLTNGDIVASSTLGLKVKDYALADIHISAVAGISYSKLNLGSSIVNADISGTAGIAYSKLSLSSSILNSDISGTAGIVYSKLNLLSSIVNADISGTAGIAYSKLSLASSIVDGDISAIAAIGYSKLNLANSIVNGDISSSAAIAYSKLSLASSIVNNDISGSAAIAWSKIDKTSSNLTDLATRSHTSLSDIGSNTHANIDTHIGASGLIHGLSGSVVGTTDTQYLENKSLHTTCVFCDPSTVTKKLDFDLSGATAVKKLTIVSAHTDSRTITLPDATTTLMGRAYSATFNDTSDWSGVGPYILSILASSHNRGLYPIVKVHDSVGDLTNPEVNINFSTGDITVTSSSKFVGRYTVL